MNLKVILIVTSQFLFISLSKSQETQGNVSFSFTTTANDGSFSPKHVLAVWVENSGGSFVKTLKLNADKRKQYLYTWNSKSTGNTTDAITGATLSSHQSHSLNWNMHDVSGNVVSDGDYSLRVEYTSAHAQGPLLSVNFNKSTSSVSLQPSDASYFKTISLSWVPENTTGIGAGIFITTPRIWPNPIKDKFSLEISSNSNQLIIISIYDMNLRKLQSLYEGYIEEGVTRKSFQIDNSSLKEGNYFIVFENGNSIHAEKVMILK
jgi:hypothetical protein